MKEVIGILSINLANNLLLKDFKLKYIGKNTNDKTKCVFYFENTSEILKSIAAYKGEYHNEKKE